MAARFAFVLVVLGCLPLHSATLVWTAAENQDWNTTATNWSGLRSNYLDGDSVSFRALGAGDVFIGSNGIPMGVAPAEIAFYPTESVLNGRRILGGDITSGIIKVFGTTVYFVDYSSSLSFPDGFELDAYFNNPSQVWFDMSHLPTGAAVHLGTGPITLRSLSHLGLSASNAGTYTFENDIRGYGNVSLRTSLNAALRLTGTMFLEPRLLFGTYEFSGVETATNEIAGPVVLTQGTSEECELAYSGWIRDLRITGTISDGPGPNANRMTFNTYYGGIVIASSNTYAHGTRIRSSGAPAGPVTVLPGATLGIGDVDASLGMLVLTDPGNISREATLKWGYQITVTNRAKIRVASAMHNGSVLAHGVYTSANMASILGDGSIRTPGMNIPPTVVVTAPTNGAAVRDDDIVRFRVEPGDVDGFIERVDFYLDGFKVRTRTNAPFSVSFTNVNVGTHLLEAVVYDDDGGSVVSSPVIFHVRTRLTPTISTNGSVVQFPVAAKTSYTLQMTHTLSPPAWSNVMSVGPGSPRLIRYTNSALPPPSSFYRVITP